jgi:cell division GTPase FtsZ
MGGGTGTGAASVIARVAKEFGILTVAVVTKPFLFEGKRRMRVAEAGIAELKRHVDTLLVIPNQNLFKVANDRTPFGEAFLLADQVLYAGVACIVDLVVKEGLINLDLADVRAVLSGMGTAMMGTGEASGENRAVAAAKEAVENPLLDDVTLRGAKSLLLSISGGSDLTLFEVHDTVDCVRAEVDPEANIIFGATLDENLTGKLRVSIVASGMTRALQPADKGANGADRAQGNGRDYRARLSEALEWPATEEVVIRERLQRPSASEQAERGRRQIPGIEEFPPPAQREYWAKSAGSTKAKPVELAPVRKPGLLERLAGGAWDRKRQSAAARPSPEGSQEQVDVPVFFENEPRK